MGISIGSIRPSMAIIYNNELYIVSNCEHSKLGRGGAFCRVKLKNMRSGQTLDATLRDSDNVDSAYIDKRKLQYSYHDGDFYHFMDTETYEDLILEKSHIDDKVDFLKDNVILNGLFYENELIDLDLPLTMELKVTEAPPGFRGDTVKGGSKPATLETGLVVQVPLFINPGELIKIDTRSREYMGRA